MEIVVLGAGHGITRHHAALKRRLDEMPEKYGDIIKVDDVILVVGNVMVTVRGNFLVADLELFNELEGGLWSIFIRRRWISRRYVRLRLVTITCQWRRMHWMLRDRYQHHHERHKTYRRGDKESRPRGYERVVEDYNAG